MRRASAIFSFGGWQSIESVRNRMHCACQPKHNTQTNGHFLFSDYALNVIDIQTMEYASRLCSRSTIYNEMNA